VLVVGGGVAGMECAIVLARRGARRVHLVDAAGELGGYASLLAGLPGLHEWSRLVAWRRRQLDKLGVEVTTGARFDSRLVAEHEARLVVLATGARWRRDGTSHVTHEPIPGWESAHVTTPEELLAGAGADAAPERALVYDCEGYVAGVGVAEHLALRGARVELVTPHAIVAPTLDRTFEGAWARRRLAALGVVARTATVLAGIEPQACTLTGPDGERRETVDLVVLLSARRSDDALHRALRDDVQAGSAGLDAVFAIGDCVAPRLLADCVFDGHRLGREIDSERPERPLAVRRERRVMGAP
jgi:dimethylamine/trimethylamine dehydrogenase